MNEGERKQAVVANSMATFDDTLHKSGENRPDGISNQRLDWRSCCWSWPPTAPRRYRTVLPDPLESYLKECRSVPQCIAEKKLKAFPYNGQDGICTCKSARNWRIGSLTVLGFSRATGKHHMRSEPEHSSRTHHVTFARPASNRNMPIQIKWTAAVAWLCLVLLAGCSNGPGSGSTNWQYTAGRLPRGGCAR